MNGPLSIAGRTLMETVARLRAHEPTVADAIKTVLQTTEADKTAASGVHEAGSRARSDAYADLEDMRRQRRHKIDNSPPGRKPEPDLIASFDVKIADAEADLAQKSNRLKITREEAMRTGREFTRLRDFAASLDPATVKIAKAVPAPRGATVETVRAEIEAVAHEMEVVRSAPDVLAALLERARGALDTLAPEGAVSIDPRRRSGDPFKLAEHLQDGHMAGKFLVWLLRDEIEARLASMIPDLPNAMTDEQRAKRLADLATEKLRLERIEETLIRAARAEGRIIARREDADPLAVLGIEVKGARP